MSIVVSTETRIRNIIVTSETITAYLVDGRVVSVPPAWSWRLSEATPAQRANFKVIGDGQGVHWPDVDEDISVEGMLHGVPARRPLTLTHFLDVKQQKENGLLCQFDRWRSVEIFAWRKRIFTFKTSPTVSPFQREKGVPFLRRERGQTSTSQQSYRKV